MSRYLIGYFEGAPILVGYDPPLQTFFGQIVVEEEDGEDRIILWVGVRPQEIQTVDHLQVLMQPWATIPEAIATQLTMDQVMAPPPSPLQQHMRELFGD